MKRSTMEYYLAGLLSTMYETEKHPETQLPNARHILYVLEKMGMKPPLTKNCPIVLDTRHVWESENDL